LNAEIAEVSQRFGEVELTRFGGHLTVIDTEVFSESIIEKGRGSVESQTDVQR
jgi:hypothetical protein